MFQTDLSCYKCGETGHRAVDCVPAHKVGLATLLTSNILIPEVRWGSGAVLLRVRESRTLGEVLSQAAPGGLRSRSSRQVQSIGQVFLVRISFQIKRYFFNDYVIISYTFILEYWNISNPLSDSDYDYWMLRSSPWLMNLCLAWPWSEYPGGIGVWVGRLAGESDIWTVLVDINILQILQFISTKEISFDQNM